MMCDDAVTSKNQNHQHEHHQHQHHQRQHQDHHQHQRHQHHHQRHHKHQHQNHHQHQRQDSTTTGRSGDNNRMTQAPPVRLTDGLTDRQTD
jgi:hypothetical protein